MSDYKEYKSNSIRSKDKETPAPEKKKMEKVTSGVVKTRKKNKLLGAFIADDIDSVKNYIFVDVLIPALKNIIADVVTNTIEMSLGIDGGRNTRRGSSASKVSYRGYYDEKRDRGTTQNTTRNTGYSYDDIVVATRGEAQEVLNRMDETIAAYGMVSVADLYDLVDINGNYTDNKYGWIDLRTADAVRVRDGYLLKLPKALPLQ